MRDLNKNTFTIWYIIPSEKEEVMDGEFHTGEYKSVFTEPIKANISMYPSNSNITEELFGKDSSIDMIASSTKLNFTDNTLIFMSKPTSEYYTTYDYSISEISKSLNVNTYGLKKRV